MEQFCCACCKDIDIPLQHLIMPEVFLDPHGLEFMRAHGLLDPEFRKNGTVQFKMNDHDYTMRFLHLMLPLAYLDGEGQKFFLTHGIYEAIRRNVVVKLSHRCAQLTSAGRCGIYESRPKTCRDYDCSTRMDCTSEEPKLLQVLTRASA